MTLAETPQLFPSNILGRQYREIEIVGQGGESLVYKAVQVDEGIESRIVAVKECSQKRTKQQGWKIYDRFKRQAEFMHQLKHQNIVDFDEFVEGNGRFLELYLIMEFLEGKNLRQHLHTNATGTGKALPLDELVGVNEQVLAALEHAHSKNIIHRDLKPEQIMLLPNGTVKLLDFGSGKAISGRDTATLLTSAGATYQYAAPEQLGFFQENYSPATDVYAFSVMLYEMIAGHQLPRDEKDFHHRVPNGLNLGRFEDIIKRGIEWEPEKRATLDDFREALGGKKRNATGIKMIERLIESLDEFDAGLKEVPLATLEAITETALARPTGTLVPSVIDRNTYALTNEQLPWYIRHAGKIGAVVGTPGFLGISAGGVTGISYLLGYPLHEIIQKFTTNFIDQPVGFTFPIAISSLMAGGVMGAISGKVFRDRNKIIINQTRALAAPDEGYKKKGLGYHVVQFFDRRLKKAEEVINKDNSSFIDELIQFPIGIAVFAPALIGRHIYEKRGRFAYLDGEVGFPITAKLNAVEKEYGTKARRTLAHNYAHKMLEEGKYDEVVKVGLQVLTYVSEEKKRGYFAGRKAQRQESELLENICLGLLRRGALQELDQVVHHMTNYGKPREPTVTGSSVLGSQKFEAIEKLARDRLRSVHHNLYGKQENDEDVQQYASLCRNFDMEPNLEKLTRALVPAPMEEARDIANSDSGIMVVDKHLYEFTSAEMIERLNVTEQKSGQKDRHFLAERYAAGKLRRGDYAAVGEIIRGELTKYAVNRSKTMITFIDHEQLHLEKLLYGLLNKGAWEELAKIPGLGTTIGRIHPFGETRSVKFDTAVRQRLEEVLPYASTAPLEEKKDYASACLAFSYAEGWDAVGKKAEENSVSSGIIFI